MADVERRYFDACVVIRLLERGEGADVIEHLVEEARSGKWRMAVSTLTMLEVKGPREKLTPE